MDGVFWPFLITPGETVHLKVDFRDELIPETLAEQAIIEPASTVSGHQTVMIGQPVGWLTSCG
jgi:hypothetical protein